MNLPIRPMVLVFATAVLVPTLYAQAGPQAQAIPAQAASAQATQAQAEPLQIAPSAEEASQPLSNVRIVRLSEVRGQVQMDRNGGRGYEEAFANLPVTGGARLHTEGGVAEVEFEDNSTLRLTPDTAVEFTELKRAASGTTLSQVKVLEGTVYVSLARTRGNIFNVLCGNSSLELSPASHIRLTVGGPQAQLTVLDGNVGFHSPGGVLTLSKKKALTFYTTEATPPVPAKDAKGPFDEWDKNEANYHKRYASLAATGGSGMLYGTSDLNYYGSFVDMPGCGSMWRPYFTTAAWDPYGNGMWAWYPGAGYSWVSPYPWGWLPFHYGSWQFCGAGGWGWQPGGRWSGLRNTPRPIHSTNHPCPKPPLPPLPGRPQLVAVNTRPLVVSRAISPEQFAFRRDSAGLGVPRETFGKLGRTSAQVEHQGAASASIQMGYIGPAAPAAHGTASVAGPGSPGRSTWAESHPVSSISRSSGSSGFHGAGASSAGGWSGASHGSWGGGGGASAPSAASSHMGGAAPAAASSGASSHK